MKNELYLIQGIFFTNDEAVGIGFDPKIGSRAIIQSAIFRTMYAGVLKFTEDSKNGLGSLHDHYGYSTLTDVEITEESLSFKKKYEFRDDTIIYKFAKNNDFWVGSYSGRATGTGASRCVLRTVNEEFFLLDGLELLFKSSL